MNWEDIIKEDMGDYKQTIDILRDAINQMEKTKKTTMEQQAAQNIVR